MGEAMSCVRVVRQPDVLRVDRDGGGRAARGHFAPAELTQPQLAQVTTMVTTSPLSVLLLPNRSLNCVSKNTWHTNNVKNKTPISAKTTNAVVMPATDKGRTTVARRTSELRQRRARSAPALAAGSATSS